MSSGPAALATASSAISRSGNPGYQNGRPVLAGDLVSLDSTAGTKQAISESLAGLQLFGRKSSGGICSNSTVTRQAVSFGKDMLMQCAMPLRRSDFAGFCTSSGAAAVVPQFLGAVQTHLGLFGNADPLKTWQWLEISKSAATPAPILRSDGVHCDGTVRR